MNKLFGVERQSAVGSRSLDRVWPHHTSEATAYEEWRRLVGRDGLRIGWLLLRFHDGDVGWQVCTMPTVDDEWCPT